MLEPVVEARVVRDLLRAIRDALWRGAKPLEVARIVDEGIEKLEERMKADGRNEPV